MKKNAFIGMLLAVLLAAGWILLPRFIHGFIHGPVYIDYRHSGFQDFMEIDDMAYSRCVLTVMNDTSENVYVRISATADWFDRHNLFAQKELTGYTMDMRSEVFPLDPGENALLVYFGAPYGGTYQRFGRTLPWNIRIEAVPAADPEIAAVSEDMHYGGKILLGAGDIAAGITSAELDVDKDGMPERLEFCVKNGNPETEVSGGERYLQISLYDDGVLSDQLEQKLSPFISGLTDVLAYDFGFADGSLELILRYQERYAIQFENHDLIEYEESAIGLVRVANGRLAVDTGSIYGSGGYHIEPAEMYSGELHSISGNRVTIEGKTMPPIRIDLDENLFPAS